MCTWHSVPHRHSHRYVGTGLVVPIYAVATALTTGNAWLFLITGVHYNRAPVLAEHALARERTRLGLRHTLREAVTELIRYVRECIGPDETSVEHGCMILQVGKHLLRDRENNLSWEKSSSQR